MVSAPYNMMPPGPEPPMTRDALVTLQDLPGLFVRQDLQILEEFLPCLERQNKYKICAAPPGQLADNPTDLEFRALPSVLEVREKSSFCCRFCCANRREFVMGLFPGNTPKTPHWPEGEEPMLSLYRPFKCSIYLCCCLLWPQELSIADANGENLGKVVEDCRCFDCCFKCTCWAKAFDAQGHHKYSFKAPLCGRNCFAPSCCNETFRISVSSGENERNVLSYIKNIWPGCNFRGLFSANADNFVLEFPDSATPKDKALILGAMFLIDFLLFERSDHDSG